ncbi:Gfo/Idh/MocA family protein [Brachybacterium aquaticum]|uniref:Putative dehydrogenase n=1 Tax=Brachybacterium aquaticum TaxID=1432564 RepID=A0A841AIR7_9MICO|nr:Gfo/Idh/MocA family oxidoreductase [Brachybacterium aquaticum]MBB5832928.1 putative dehydrogenase [Brachybacterium aquaticum]
MLTSPSTSPQPQSQAARRPLRIALLSCAHTHAATYAALLEARDDVELVVADPDGYGDVQGVRVVAGYEEAWEAWPGGPDAVIVTSANAHHCDLVLEAARRGVHVLCEKPLATTVADAEAMRAACDEAGVVLMTAFPVHFSPAVQALRAAIADGTLGEVVGLTGTNNGVLPTARDWFTDVALAGGGSLVDHTVHVAEILDSVLGEPASVHAVTNRILAADRAGEGAETGGLVTLTYDSGVVATIDCSWSQPADAPTWGGLTLQAVGTGGQLQIDAFAQHVGGPGRWLPYGTDLDALLLDSFLTAVRRGEAAAPDGEVGLRTLRVVAAAQESVRTGQPVALAR